MLIEHNSNWSKKINQPFFQLDYNFLQCTLAFVKEVKNSSFTWISHIKPHQCCHTQCSLLFSEQRKSSLTPLAVIKSPSPMVCSHVTLHIYPFSKQWEELSKYLKLWKSFDSVVSTNDTLYYHFNLDSDPLWQFYHYSFIHVNGCVMTVTTSADHSSIFHTIFPLAGNESISIFILTISDSFQVDTYHLCHCEQLHVSSYLIPRPFLKMPSPCCLPLRPQFSHQCRVKL